MLFSIAVLPTLVLAAPSDIDPSPQSSVCPSLQNNLRYQSRDAYTNGEVSTLQDFLQSQGYLNSEPTGYFGLLTFQAVKNFQNANGISPTGYVGPITRAKIASMNNCGTATITPVSPTPVQSSISAPTVYLGANPTTIVSDGKPGTITLYWSSTNATSCGFERQVLPTSGSMTVLLSSTTTYTISCTGPGGSTTSNPVTVIFKSSQNLPAVDLKINNSDGPLTKSSGYSTFSWISANADYCTASGDSYWSGSKSTSGSESIWTGNQKTGVTTYQLTCGTSSGKVNSAFVQLPRGFQISFSDVS